MTVLRTSTAPRRRIPRRALVLLVAVALLAVLGIAAGPLAHALTGRSIGTLIAEHDGHLVTERFRSAAEASRRALPDWLPSSATTVTIARPGAEAGLAGAVRIDAVVPQGTPAPAVCSAATAWSMPFATPDDWPPLTTSSLRTCGEWTLGIRTGHWYLWSATAGSL